MSAMPRLFDLPLFPLGLVLYPEERLPLHIFEERYKEMARECIANDRPFGVILYEEGKMAEVGCTAQIVEITKEYEDGRLDIVVVGEERFRVSDVRQERSFLTVDAEMIEESGAIQKQLLVERLITQHIKLLELAGRTARPNLYREVRHVSYVVANNSGLNVEQKQKLLEIQTEDERVAYLVSHLETLLPAVEQSQQIRTRVQSNGYFEDFPPDSE